MGTLTKQVSDITTLGNYTAYGSSTNPFNEAIIAAQPISPASIIVTVTGTGADLAITQTIIDLTGPNNGDQLIRIVLRSGGAVPTTPTDRTLIDISVISTSTAAQVATALNTALGNSNVITSNSVSAESVTFSPDCGGDWSSSITGSSATVAITDGGAFGTPSTRTQAGVRITVGLTGNGFNQVRMTFTEDHWGSNTEKDIFWFANLGGTQSGWQATTGAQNFSLRGSGTTNTVPGIVAESITSWNANQDDEGSDMATSLGDRLWELVAVTGDTSSFDIYALDDNDDIDLPIVTRNDATVNFTVESTERIVNIIIPSDPDPHKIATQSQIRFFDSTATNFNQIAPNYIKTGAFSTWTMDNFSIDFGVGFRFNNSAANSTTLNWDQVDIIKSGDGQGSGGSAMFNTNVTETLNWNNCTVKWYPLSADNNLSAFMIDAGPGNITLNWDRVFIRYSGNSQMHTQFEISSSSSLTNSGIIGDGTSAGGVFNNPVVTFPLARLLTPFNFIVQNRPIVLTAPPILSTVSDSYSNSSLFVGFNNGGPGVSTSTIFRPFVNQTSYFKFIDFISANQIYINEGAFQNTASATTVNPDGSLEYAVTFNPEYFDQSASSLTNVRNEFRYGSSTDNSELRVKETFESGPIGGSLATLTGVVANANFAVGDIFTIPRPNGLGSVTVTAVTGTPVQSGDTIQFNIGTDVNTTIANIAASFRASTNTSLGVWFNNPLSATLSIKNFIFGNNIGGTAGLATYSGTATNVTISSLQTGTSGSGTFTHPFNAGISYIDLTDGLLKTNTFTDNKYKANTSTSTGVGNNDGLFLTYNKTNYLNNFQGAGNAQTDISLYKSQYTVYTKRSGFRPEIAVYNFSDGPQNFSKILITDINWENVAKSTVDAYTRTSINTVNDLYRWVENETDDRTITIETNNLPSVYDRLISFNSPVDSGALADFGSLDLELNLTSTNPTYRSSDPPTVLLPIQTTINTGGTVLGVKTSGNTRIAGNIDFNDVIIESLGTLNTSSSAITNGIIRANVVTATGSDFTNTQFQLPPGSTSYTITHGGNFDSVTMEAGGTLNTSDNSLHGLTADTVTINYTGVATSFSVDSPGAITTSTFTFNNIASNLTWNIDEDLSTCFASTTTSNTILMTIGPNGTPPPVSNLTGNFVLARRIQAPGSWFYRVENAATGELITENFTTPVTNQLNFNSTAIINAYLVRSDVENQQPIIVRSEVGNASVVFIAESDLDLAIQDSTASATRTLVTDYLTACTVTANTTNHSLVVTVPTSFTSASITQNPTTSIYWDSNGGRGSGQYFFKLLEKTQKYAEVILGNLSILDTEGRTQLISLLSLSRLVINTENLTLASVSGTSVIAFFPGQFINNDAISNTFSIISTTLGLVILYQAVSTAVIDENGAILIRAQVADELNDRRVTRPNMNFLGILAPINDTDPT